ncbi:MAG: glycoside hydrolase family 13 protein [Lachnospiraceae bacterium]|nr:glycoside hydrolase family 13 protein [Lachnospiraceae bacterium]
MERSAVLHIPMSQYAYGTEETHVTIRLRAKGNDLKSVFLYYGDRACRLTPVIFTKVEMARVANTELYDYFEAELDGAYKRLCYYFELSDGHETVLYYGDQFCDEPVDDRSEYYQLPFNHRADLITPPEWAQDAVIYNIFPDSFATSGRFLSGEESVKAFGGAEVRGKLGGTIGGITQNADYLKSLGVNAIYINPIFAAGEYHKYDILDYFKIDPCFGSNEDFRELVVRFHENGIRVIIDGVFNHCGWKFFAFEDVVQKGEASAYKDWFYGLTFPVVRPDDPEAYPNYECFGYERLMPKLNLANPETAEYFCSVGKYWIENYDIDGWRLDVASEVNDGFWRAFYRTVKAAKPDAILIGEVWESAGHWLDGTIFDSAMNYDFRKHCRRFFAERTIDAAEFDVRVTDMLMRYRRQTAFAQLNILDSHDVSRFLSLCGGDREQYEAALLFQMTFPGMPSVFYGDECGILGLLEKDYRRAMDWESSDSLFTFFKEVISLRKNEELLRRGNFRTVRAKRGSRVFQYERYRNAQRIRIVINMEEQEFSLSEESVCGQILLEKGRTGRKLAPLGYVVSKSCTAEK